MTAAAMDTRLHPIVAIRAIRQFLRNPQDPANANRIFDVIRAMRGRSGLKVFRRFAASTSGADLLRRRPSLIATLNDRAALAALPDGTVGRGYFRFMDGEALSAQMLVDASEDWEGEGAPADLRFFRARTRDAHDLHHVITGYGRDGLGELCLLTYLYAHTGNLGVLMVVSAMWFKIPKVARAAIAEAWRNGRKARWFLDLDYEALLPRPLTEVRRDLNITTPEQYDEVGRMMQARMATQAAAA